MERVKGKQVTDRRQFLTYGITSLSLGVAVGMSGFLGEGKSMAAEKSDAKNASKSALNVVLEWSGLYAQQELEAAFELLSPDAEWIVHGSAQLPWPVVSKGRDQILKTWAIQHEVFTRLSMEMEAPFLNGDEVIIFGAIKDVATATKKVAEFNFCARFSVQKGQINTYQMYADSHAFSQALLP